MASGSKTCPEGFFSLRCRCHKNCSSTKKNFFIFLAATRSFKLSANFCSNFFCNFFFAKQAKHGCHFFLFYLPECSRRWSTAALWIGSRTGQVLSRLYIKRGDCIAQRKHSCFSPSGPGFISRPCRDFSLLFSLWTVERSNPSSAYARDFANAASGKGLC